MNVGIIVSALLVIMACAYKEEIVPLFEKCKWLGIKRRFIGSSCLLFVVAMALLVQFYYTAQKEINDSMDAFYWKSIGDRILLMQENKAIARLDQLEHDIEGLKEAINLNSNQVAKIPNQSKQPSYVGK